MKTGVQAEILEPSLDKLLYRRRLHGLTSPDQIRLHYTGSKVVRLAFTFTLSVEVFRRTCALAVTCDWLPGRRTKTMVIFYPP